MTAEGRPTAVLLVGPKGAGKTTLGREMERKGLARFLPVETIMIAAMERATAEGGDPRALGYRPVQEALERILSPDRAVVLELTGAHPESADFVVWLRERSRVLLVRVLASEATCSARLATRERRDHIPFDAALVSAVRQRHDALEWPWDLVLGEGAPAAAETVGALLGPRSPGGIDGSAPVA